MASGVIEDRDELPAGAKPGRMSAFHGQMGMFVRALSYMLSHGKDGVRQASEDAVLSANYILASLKDVMSAPFGDGPCMHEALFDDSFLEGTGVTTLDFAKAMIDEGYHPMTMYFPLVVHGAMLIEPTESESKESLDRFIHVLRVLAEEAKAGNTARFEGAPRWPPPPPRRDRGGTQASAALETTGAGRRAETARGSFRPWRRRSSLRSASAGDFQARRARRKLGLFTVRTLRATLLLPPQNPCALAESANKNRAFQPPRAVERLLPNPRAAWQQRWRLAFKRAEPL